MTPDLLTPMVVVVVTVVLVGGDNFSPPFFICHRSLNKVCSCLNCKKCVFLWLGMCGSTCTMYILNDSRLFNSIKEPVKKEFPKDHFAAEIRGLN